MAMVDAIKQSKVTLVTLGPAAVHRLRTHRDPDVARRAGDVIQELRGPEVKEKNALLAKLTPTSKNPATPTTARNCSPKTAPFAIALMAKAARWALTSVAWGRMARPSCWRRCSIRTAKSIPSFNAWSIETSDGETHDGVIISEKPHLDHPAQ
jgi:hypothetical protein